MTAPYTCTAERRYTGKDRRSRKAPDMKSLFLHRRRKTVRREEDRHKMAYLDLYNTRHFVAVVAIVLLSLTDALLTLFLIDHGATELNPVMWYFLQFGPYTFIFAKFFLTWYAAMIILIFHNFFIEKLKIYTHRLFAFTITAFAMVIGWELFLSYKVFHPY